jgi:uncharacterized metal-binding protein YceD (DUF177 family)
MKRPPAPEFSRPLQTDRVPRAGSTEKLKADPPELKALAKRMNLPAIHSLTAEIRATPWRGGGIKLEGHLTADIEQVSVISLEAFRETVSIPVSRYFLPPNAIVKETEGEDDDADPIENGYIDLGEVTAETLALDLDPYPRKPGEAFAEHIEAEPEPAAKESPFAVLAKRQPE